MSLENLRALRRGALAGARRLDLCCDLTALPPEVFDLADTLMRGDRRLQLFFIHHVHRFDIRDFRFWQSQPEILVGT